MATNPFVRPMSDDLQATVGLRGAELVDVFAETRKRKDSF
jgi:hydroxyacylglutathione hydrolase